ncbi:MAG: hypothetical protein KME58_17115 [Candidatus Thiodiazotropha sp. (ex Lucina pensylvanica)]|nr:hypothetical protein [Candidatus Thiodiazotropha sp. (ex Lucina pensylvanica)]
MDIESFKDIENEFSELFSQLSNIQSTIREKLTSHADGKTLKGNELVGWLGEVYGKYLFNGYLVDDSFEHDVETQDGLRISVKTRKGTGKGWNRTSAIPKIEGDDCPTHLLFVHLNDSYLVDKMWLYPWGELFEADRFKKHIVRGNMRSYFIQVNEKTDSKFLIFG